MGFRRSPSDPFAEMPEGLLETSLRLLAGGRPAHPAIEETEFPAIDVFETPAEVVIEAELPGVDPATIGVSAGEGLIVIEGVKSDDTGPGRVTFLCMERSFGAFRRVVLPGAAVDVSRTTAACRDGVLQVRVPKVEEKRGRVRVIPVVAAASRERSEP
jgi:HSP20 family molecular chaperone IbpA